MPQPLYKLLSDSLNTEELANLCTELGTDIEDLGGSGKPAKARELTALMARNKRTDSLLTKIWEQKPELDVVPYVYVLITEHFSSSDDFLKLRQSLGLPADKNLVRGYDAQAYIREEKALALQTEMEKKSQLGNLVQAMSQMRPNLRLDPFADLLPEEGDKPADPTSTQTTATPTSTTTVSTLSSTISAPAGAYANFDIRIGPKQADNRYPVTAESVYGESKLIAQTLPSDSDEFQDYISFLRDLIARDADAEGLGKMLYSFLFPKEVADLFGRSLAKAQAEGKAGLRVRLRWDPSATELSQIPWEYCRDDRSFLALNDDTPIVRYIPTDRPPESVATPQKVRILIVMASPKDQAALDVAAEEQRVRQALSKLEQAGRVEIQVIPHATRRDLRVTCRKFDPHILHFVGHGTLKSSGEGALALEGDSGETQLMDSQDLYLILQGGSTKLVILSACQTAAQGEGEALSGVAPRLVSAGVPAVIAMQFVVPDKTAIAFTRDFYDFLASGKPLDAAVTEARIGIYVDNDDKVFWAIPVLFMRSPDGVIWQ